MHKLLEMWKKKAASARRGKIVGQQDVWMKLQLSKMGRMNQKVISGSLGR